MSKLNHHLVAQEQHQTMGKAQKLTLLNDSTIYMSTRVKITSEKWKEKLMVML